MESDEKQCPQCAETVKAAAAVCKHCGYNFVSGKLPPRGSAVQPPRAPAKGVTIGCLSLVGLLILLWIIGSVVGDSDTASGGVASTEAGATSASEPPMKVTTNELYRAYDANEAAAQQKYGGRPLEVTGVVDSIDLDMTDDPVVMLKTENEFSSAHAALTDASKPLATSLSKGQSIVLICQGIGEVVGTPMLKDCDIQGG